MGKVREKDAVDNLLKMLNRFLKLSGKARENIAKDIDDFVNFDLLEYNDGYEKFSEELKDIMDALFLFHRWEGRGIHYGKELYFGMKDTKDIVKRLKKLRHDR